MDHNGIEERDLCMTKIPNFRTYKNGLCARFSMIWSAAAGVKVAHGILRCYVCKCCDDEPGNLLQPYIRAEWEWVAAAAQKQVHK